MRGLCGAGLLALSLLGAPLAGAQGQDDAAGGSAVELDDLDIWLQAEALNRRCQVLNYFETRAIADHIATRQEDLAARRDAAIKAVAERECSPKDAAIVHVRRIYVRAALKSLLASNQSEAMSNDRDGRKLAGQELMSFAARFYGPNFDAGTVHLFMELDEEGADPEAIWQDFYPTVDDIHWQLRLEQKGWKFHPHATETGAYTAVKMGEENEAYPAILGPRTAIDILDTHGERLSVSAVQGVSDEGRIVVLVSKDSADWGPVDLNATLFVQEQPDLTAWNAHAWRAAAITFAAEVSSGADCPADFCLTLPLEASAAIAARREDNGADDAFELVIGDAGQFPLDTTAPADLRMRFNPPSLRGEIGVGD